MPPNSTYNVHYSVATMSVDILQAKKLHYVTGLHGDVGPTSHRRRRQRASAAELQHVRPSTDGRWRATAATDDAGDHRASFGVIHVVSVVQVQCPARQLLNVDRQTTTAKIASTLCMRVYNNI